MATEVRLEAVLRREGLVARVGEDGTTVRLFPGVCPDVGLKVVTGGKGLATAILLTAIRFLSRMSARMLPQVTQSREELEATTFQTVERVTGMQSLVSLQSVQSIERLVTAVD